MTNEQTTALSAVNTTGQGGVELRTVSEVMTVAEIFRESGVFPDLKTTATAAVKIMAGQELGIPPFAAMRGIDIVEGKPEIKPALLAALIRRGKVYDYKVFQRDAQAARIGFYRLGEFLGESIYSWEMAEKALLTSKSNWRKMPVEMLYWRAMSNGVRVYCPDVTMGAAYVEGELDQADTFQKAAPPQTPAKADPEPVAAVVISSAPLTPPPPPAPPTAPQAPAKATPPPVPTTPDPAPPVQEPPAPTEPKAAGPVVGKITLQDRRNIQHAAEAGGMTPEDVKAYLLAIGYEKSTDVPKAELRRILADVDSGDAFRIARGLPTEEPPTGNGGEFPDPALRVDGQLVDPQTGEVLEPGQAALFT